MESSKLAELRGSLLSAANQVGEMQQQMQEAEERSRACERALLAVAAQSALRAARLSVDAIQGRPTGRGPRWVARRRPATLEQRRRPWRTYTTRSRRRHMPAPLGGAS